MMRSDLEQSKELLINAQRAYQDQDFVRAEQCLSQAAKCLISAAQQSSPPLDRIRLDTAQKVLHQANLIKKFATKQKQTKPAAASVPQVDESPAPWLIAERPTVQFKDVAGLERVKEQIKLKLIYPFSHPEHAAKFSIRSGGGILLYGPPGTGKTLIARSTAGELDAAFFVAKPSDLMSKWVGEAEQNIQRLFDSARSVERAVIFLDEIDALLPKRRRSSSTVMQRIVPQFLTELEGFEGHSSGLLLIGATNEPWSIDPAALRPGRFDEKIYVPLPDLDGRRQILALNLQERPLDDDVDLDLLADKLIGYSGADIAQICLRASTLAFMDAVERGTERNIEWSDFEVAYNEIAPSVSEQMLRRFEQFGQRQS
ncbi:ATP-binding protein [Chloroflexi bacterium TSY]|nr:ATP-binding protein [Chloroflexi bacterium TSY]